MLLLYIFILVMLFSSVPYLIRITKNASSVSEMRRQLESEGCKLKTVSPFWYMGTIDGRRADFHVLCEGKVISVKVVSFMSSGIALNFSGKDSYSIKKLKPSETDADISTYKVKKKAPYDFKAGLPSEWAGLPSAKVIMILDPYPTKITRTGKDGKARVLDIADSTGEGELYSLLSFIELFRK